MKQIDEEYRKIINKKKIDLGLLVIFAITLIGSIMEYIAILK